MRSGMKASSAADVSPDPVMRGAGIRDRQSGVADETRSLSILKGSIITLFVRISKFSPLFCQALSNRGDVWFCHCGC